ncbi:MAG: hypothetical protein RLY61_346 [Candidatus Parcubacteria bacterium]
MEVSNGGADAEDIIANAYTLERPDIDKAATAALNNNGVKAKEVEERLQSGQFFLG